MTASRSSPSARLRPALGLGWALLLAAGPAFCAETAVPGPAATPIRSFHIGNSLTDTLDGWLEPLAREAGLPLEFHRFTIPGAPTDWLWAHPGTGFGDSDYRAAFRHLAPIGHLVVQPFAGHNRSVAEEAAAIGRFHQLCRQTSPGVRLWLYQQWPARDVPEPWSRGVHPLGRPWELRVPELDLEPDETLDRRPDGWRQLRRLSPAGGWAAAARHHSRYFELLRRELAARFPEARVGIIPAGPALALLKEHIDAGLIPGIRDFEAACFADDIHLKPPGRYLVSLVHLACFLGASPEGRVGAGASGLTADQARWWQRIAWAAARQCRWSGVHANAASPAWRYDEEPTDSMPQRVFQWRQMKAFVRALEGAGPRSESTGRSLPFSEADQQAVLRERFRRRIGHPSPGFLDRVPSARLERIGADERAVYHRCRIKVAPEMEVYGLYIVPRKADRPLPLLIAQHGGGGFPELAAFGGGGNYRDMIRGAVERGWAVFAPHLVFYPYRDRDVGTPIPADVRAGLDRRLRRLGTSLAAVEVEKIRFALTALLRRPEVDPGRVAMTGLSYGGYYTLYTAALDERIGAAAVSCAFVDWGSPQAPIEAPDQWQPDGQLNDLTPEELAALICPRPLLVEAGRRDPLFAFAASVAMARRAAAVYEDRHAVDRFVFAGFDGGHEFRGGPVWTFLDRWRRFGPSHSANRTANR